MPTSSLFCHARVTAIFVLATAVVCSTALVGVPDSPAAAAEAAAVNVPIKAAAVAPLASESLDVSLGGVESPILTSSLGAPLDVSAVAATPKKLKDPVSSKFDLKGATLIGRDELTDRYRDADGETWASLSPTPKNAFDKSSRSWKPLSESLKRTGDGGAEAALHPLNPTFDSRAGAGPLMSLDRGGYSLDIDLVKASDTPLTSKAAAGQLPDEVMYRDILPDVDLSIQLDGSSLTEQLRLEKAPSVAPVWKWTYRAPGLAVSQNEFEDVEFTAPDGSVIFAIPSPVMWDSSAVAGERSDSFENVDTIVTKVKGGVDLTLSPSMKWP